MLEAKRTFLRTFVLLLFWMQVITGSPNEHMSAREHVDVCIFADKSRDVLSPVLSFGCQGWGCMRSRSFGAQVRLDGDNPPPPTPTQWCHQLSPPPNHSWSCAEDKIDKSGCKYSEQLQAAPDTYCWNVRPRHGASRTAGVVTFEQFPVSSNFPPTS